MVPFECPREILQIRVNGNHARIKQNVRVDLFREDMEPSMAHPLRTVEAAEAALTALAWIRRRYDVAEYEWVLEDKLGKYICGVKIKGNQVQSGDCAGAGKGSKKKAEPEKEGPGLPEVDEQT